jgi:predicted alpha/beta-fold hydrolase
MLEYRPPRWLPGGNLQTIVPYFFRKRPLPGYRRERITTPDNDFIDLDWVDGPLDRPLVILFHGLEGSSSSHYARAMMHEVAARGWRGVVPHWRGCSGEPNLLPRAYHSGDHAEAGWLIETIRNRAQPLEMFAIGVSLGGSALLNWLGRAGGDAASADRRSGGVDATQPAHRRGSDPARLQPRLLEFLLTLRRKASESPGASPDRSRSMARRSRTLYAFDDAYTAPMHGFAMSTTTGTGAARSRGCRGSRCRR